MLSKCLKLDIENFEQWLNFNGASKNTITAYTSDFRQLLKSEKLITKENIEVYTIDNWRELFSKLQDEKLSYKSQERYLAALRSYSKYKKTMGISITIMKLASLRKKDSDHISNVDLEDIFNFLSYFNKTEIWQEYRDKVLVYLLYSAGLRINEVLELKWVDLYTKYVKIKGKGSKIRAVPLFPFIKVMIDEYKNSLNFESEYIFISNNKKTKLHACSVARKFRKACLKLNLKNITPHTLRHACATHLMKAGCNLRSIQALLGHSSLEITKIYINSTQDELKNDYFSII